MADIKQIIKDTIKPNGEGLITGGTLQGTLLAMVSALDGGAFRGILTPERCSPDDYDAAEVADRFDKSQKWWYILFAGSYALPTKNPRAWESENGPIEAYVGIPKLQVYAHHIGIYYSDGTKIALITQRYEAGRRKIVFGRRLPEHPNIGDIYIVSGNEIKFREGKGRDPLETGPRTAVQIVAPFEHDDALSNCISIIPNFNVVPAPTPTKRFNVQTWRTEYIGLPKNPYGELSPRRVTCARRVRATKTVGKKPNEFLKSIQFFNLETRESVNLHHTKIGLTCNPSSVRIPENVPYFYLAAFRHYKRRVRNDKDLIIPRRVSKFAYKFVARKYNGRENNTSAIIEPQEGKPIIIENIYKSGFPERCQYVNIGVVDFAVLKNWGGELLEAS